MPELGGSPRKLRHRRSLDRSAAVDRTQRRSASKGDRLTLWQLLFGKDTQRRAGRNSTNNRLQVKQASFAVSDPATEVLQSFRSNRRRVKQALEKARSSALPDFDQQVAPEQSRRSKISRLPAKGQTAEGANSIASNQARGLRRPLRASKTTLQSRSLTVLQPAQTNERDRGEDLSQRRSDRASTSRGFRSSNAAMELSNLRAPRERQRPLSFHAAEPPAARNRSAPQTRRRDATRPRRRSASIALYATRMLILSIGVGVLAGTILSVWDPAHRAPAGTTSQVKQANITASRANQAAPNVQLPKLGQEIVPLKSVVQTLTTQTPQVIPGIFFFDLDSTSYIDLNGEMLLPAASTIKVPILVAFFQDVDAGKIRLDELLTLQRELIGGGSGDMQYQSPGSQFTALETITKMITISDNTATNLLIARLGGIAALNQRFKSWGLAATAINSLLPDLEGTNTTSAKDMALLMARISQGELVSLRSRDRMLEVMRKTVTDSLLPRGLGEGATIAHKTGDIGSLVGDVGLIDAPNGKRYVAAVLVKRAYNDERAQELIRQISRVTYQHFSGSQASTNRSAATSPPTGQLSPETNTETLRQPSDTPVNPTLPTQATPVEAAAR